MNSSDPVLLLLSEILDELKSMNAKLDDGLSLANSPVGRIARKATATWQGLGGKP